MPPQPARDEDTPFFARSFEYARGEDTGWHSHPHRQLIYAVAGVMTVETHSGVWVVPSLRAVWIPARTSHRVVMNSRVSMRTAFFDTRRDELAWGECFVVQISPLMRELLVAATQLSHDALRGKKGTLICDLAIDELACSQTLPLNIPQPKDPRLRRITDAILAAPSISSTFDELGSDAGASQRTLARLFESETGLSFRQWRQQAILLWALQRLALGASVTSVALDLGYGSPSAFSHMFRKALGTSPSAYFTDGSVGFPSP